MDEQPAQLRLTPETGDDAPLVLDLKVPARLVKLLRRLEPPARFEFAMRAPSVLLGLLTRLVEVGGIPDDELRVRRGLAERDAEELRREEQRRALKRRQCPSCHALDSHLAGCERAAA